MTDVEIRWRLLKHFYDLRHNNGGWVPASDMIMSPDPVRFDVIAGVCQQLADVGLIQWKSLKGPEGVVAGSAKITGQGAAAVEAGGSTVIDIRFSIPTADGAIDIAPSAPVPATNQTLAPEASHSASRNWTDPITVKPSFMGLSVDLKEGWRLFTAWRKRPMKTKLIVHSSSSAGASCRLSLLRQLRSKNPGC